MAKFCTESSALSDCPCVFYCVIVLSYCSFCGLCAAFCVITNTSLCRQLVAIVFQMELVS